MLIDHQFLLELYFDNITLKGRKTTPFVYFNGKASPADMGSPFGWGDGSASTLEVVSGAGTSSETNAQMDHGW